MQTLRRTLAILIVPAIACLGAACEGMSAPTQPPPPVAALNIRVLSGSDCLDDDDDKDGVPNAQELLFGLLSNDSDSDDDGILDGNDDANGNGKDDEDEDDDDDECPDRDSDGDGEDDEDEDDDDGGGGGGPTT